MIGVFKQKNPGNNLLLLVYALILKFHLFLNPLGPLQLRGDHFFYTWLLEFFETLSFPPFLFSLLTFLLLYLQASLFNRICNAQKMLEKSTYLPAMAYILLTSLFVEWNQFSAPLLINSFLIWVFYKMVNLYNTNYPGTAIFNVGMIMGVITLLYHPAIVFILLILFTLFMMRPFIIREWLIAFVGITTPYYFLALILFLTNNWNIQHLIPTVTFAFPSMPYSIFVTISIALLVIPFMIGGYFVQTNLSKMLIQVRKSWSLMLLFLIIAVTIMMINGGSDYVNWILCVVPLSAFHAAAYYYPLNKVFPLVLHFLTFGYAVYINYFLKA